VPASC